MSLQGKKVLVTGAGGFIGSHLAERLLELGVQTRALVHYNAKQSWGWLDESPLKDQLEVIAGDITDQDCVEQAMTRMDVVFHLAALIAIPYSYGAPRSYVRTNIEGTLNIMQAARRHGTSRVVHTSTSEVYGTARYVPINEGHPLQGQSPYSASKIGADKIAESYFCSFNVPVVIVRPFNTFGPRQSMRAVVPTIITQCLSGTQIRLGKLTPSRDLNYVADTVDGFIRAASVTEAVGETVNLGSGREISIGDLAHLIGRLTGRAIEISCDEQRLRPDLSEVERLLADNQKASTLLGWKPKISLEEGLQRTIAWMSSHAGRYRSSVYTI